MENEERTEVEKALERASPGQRKQLRMVLLALSRTIGDAPTARAVVIMDNLDAGTMAVFSMNADALECQEMLYNVVNAKEMQDTVTQTEGLMYMPPTGVVN
jgi:hypothetical protein